MPSLQWQVDNEGANGSRHIANFGNLESEAMVVSMEMLDDQPWYTLAESDPDVLDVGDQDVFFNSPDAAKEYAQALYDEHIQRTKGYPAKKVRFMDPVVEAGAAV